MNYYQDFGGVAVESIKAESGLDLFRSGVEANNILGSGINANPNTSSPFTSSTSKFNLFYQYPDPLHLIPTTTTNQILSNKSINSRAQPQDTTQSNAVRKISKNQNILSKKVSSTSYASAFYSHLTIIIIRSLELTLPSNSSF
jgi:hypothetical protein